MFFVQQLSPTNVSGQRDKPAYRIGHGVVLAYLSLFLFCGSGLQWWYLARENRKRRRGDVDHWVEGKSKEEILKLGDRRCVAQSFPQAPPDTY